MQINQTILFFLLCFTIGMLVESKSYVNLSKQTNFKENLQRSSFSTPQQTVNKQNTQQNSENASQLSDTNNLFEMSQKSEETMRTTRVLEETVTNANVSAQNNEQTNNNTQWPDELVDDGEWPDQLVDVGEWPDQDPYIVPQTPAAPVIYEGEYGNLTVPTWLHESVSELDVFLTDHYNYFVTSSGNRVWSGAMNLAWDQLKRNLLAGQNATFQNLNNVIEQTLVENLNSNYFTRNDISEDSYYVASGFGKQTVDKINRQVRQKFPSRTFDDINLDLADEDFISYAYLYKHLQFIATFDYDPSCFFKNRRVDGFKMSTSKQRKQLYYKYYNKYNDFMMGIETTNPNEEVLLLRSPYAEFNQFRFQKVLKIVSMYDQLPNKKLDRIDMFGMPVLDFDFTRKIQEMQGLKFTNPTASSAHVSGTLEKLKLKVTKEGVTLQNQAYLFVTSGWGLNPKYFFLDNDFWFILKEKNKSPYLIMLVRSLNEKWSN